LLLEIYDASVVGVIVGFDGLGSSSLATRYANVALICETSAAMRVAGKFAVLRERSVSMLPDMIAACCK